MDDVSRLCAANIENLTKDLVYVREFMEINVEFTRRPRGINEVDHWEAREFRLYLLYLGLNHFAIAIYATSIDRFY